MLEVIQAFIQHASTYKSSNIRATGLGEARGAALNLWWVCGYGHPGGKQIFFGK
jgi:hypothetical protein